MNWFLPTLPYLVSVVVLGGLVVYVGRTLQTAAAHAFVLWLWLVGLGTALFGLSIAIQDPAAKHFLLNARDAPVTFVPIATLWFVYQLTGNAPRRLTLWLKLLAIVPSIGLVLTLFSPFHHWQLYDMTVDRQTLTPSGRAGPWYHFAAVYTATVFGVALVALARSARRAPPPFKQQQWLFVWVILPSAVVRLFFAYGLSPIPGYNLTPVVLSAGCVVFAYALVWRRFLDIAPIVRQHIVELVSDLILVVDPQGRLVDANEASRRVFGLSVPVALGRPAKELLPAIAPFVSGAAPDPAATHPEVTLLDRGVPRTYELTTSEVRDASGAPLGVALLLHDVTELKQRAEAAQEEARRQEELGRLKDGFVATVSHELRTPLNAIIGLTDVLLDENLSVEVRRYVKTIHSSGEVLLALINDVLDLAKIKAGKVDLERAPFAVLRTVETAATLFAVTCEKKGLELSWYVPPELPLLAGDAARVRQILLNLVGNAVKFTQVGEIQVTVTYERSRGELRVVVADTGPGVPLDRREAIFEEFIQVDNSTTRNAGGTGLGLPIVRRLARLMGGDVTCAENPGGGSRFTLRLALAVAEAPAPRPASGGLQALTGAPTIIVGVGHPLRRRQLVDGLRHLGGQIVEAATLEAVLACRADRSLDRAAVVLDLAGTSPALLAGSALFAGGAPLVRLVLLLDSASLLRDAGAWRALGVNELLQRPGRLQDIQESLERRESGDRSQAPLAPAADLPANARRRRVLVVDDVDENRLLMGAYLKASDFHVDFATDGAQGLQTFQRGRYDLVFLDVEMPVLDGYSAVQRMRGWETEQGLAQTPIIAMTAHQGGAHRQRSEAAGFSHHLDKPVRKRDVLRLLEELVSSASVSVEPPAGEESADVVQLVQQLQGSYLASRQSELSSLRGWLHDQDYESLRRLGHNLRGSGASFGFPELTTLGEQIESAARLEQGEGLVVLVDRYEQVVSALLPAQPV